MAHFYIYSRHIGQDKSTQVSKEHASKKILNAFKGNSIHAQNIAKREVTIFKKILCGHRVESMPFDVKYMWIFAELNLVI